MLAKISILWNRLKYILNILSTSENIRKSIAENGVILNPSTTKLITPTVNHRKPTNPITKPLLLKRSAMVNVKKMIDILYIKINGLYMINTNGFNNDLLPSISSMTTRPTDRPRQRRSHFQSGSSYDFLIPEPTFFLTLDIFSFIFVPIYNKSIFDSRRIIYQM